MSFCLIMYIPLILSNLPSPTIAKLQTVVSCMVFSYISSLRFKSFLTMLLISLILSFVSGVMAIGAKAKYYNTTSTLFFFQHSLLVQYLLLHRDAFVV